MSSISGALDACLADCTEAQRQAITHPDGPLLVLAGAGSGKTRVITRRIAHLVAAGVPGHDILAITFTNKAANEMKERVEKLLGASANRGIWLSTFHSMCARMLRHHADKLGRTNAFSIYDTSDTMSVIKRVMKGLELSASDFPPGAIARVVSTLKNQLVIPEEYASRAEGPFQKAVANVYTGYERALAANNALDFDDLLVKVVALFRKAPEVRERYAHRFRHLLIDEYQDTNHAQYVIAKALASEHRNICVTGDPDQSIYGWRGADLSNILNFEQDYPDATIIKLEQNYRSTKLILTAANHLIEHNRQRKSKELRTDNPEGAPLRVMVAEDETSEARIIARDIALKAASGASYDDVAVFYRTNAQSRSIETALREAAIPHIVVAGVSFYERREVKDIVAYLRIIANPADDESLERIINVPSRGLGDTSREKLRAEARMRGVHLLDVLLCAGETSLSAKQKAGAQDLARVVRAVAGARDQPVAEQVKLLLAQARYFEYLRSSFTDADDRIRNCMELASLAAQYDSRSGETEPRNESDATNDVPLGGMAGFLETITLVSDQDELDKGQGVVKLMTLHTAKGLEFPVVYVTGLEEGLLPLQGDDDRDREEERRLFFVGLTRAKKEIVLTYALMRRKFGRLIYNQPSQFLQEIPQSVLEMSRAISPRGTDTGRGARAFRFDIDESLFSGRSETAAADAPRDSGGLLLREGDRVRHPNFGTGRIISLSGRGEQARAKVRFNSAGEKDLVLKFARLEKAR